MAILALLCGGALWAQQEVVGGYWRQREKDKQEAAEQRGYYLNAQSWHQKRPVFEAYLDDPRVVGYFSNGHECLVLLKENGQYAVNVSAYWRKFAVGAIPETLGLAMEAVLKNEIFNTTKHSSMIMGGSTHMFGVKLDGKWVRAYVSHAPKDSIGHLMGEIANLGNCDNGYDSQGHVHYIKWASYRLEMLADIVRRIDAFYGEDKRPRLDSAATRAYYAELTHDREKREAKDREDAQAVGAIPPEGAVTPQIVVPETGDFRLKLELRDLPQGHGLVVNTTEARSEFYFVLDYLDEDNAPRTQRVFLNTASNARENIVPLTAGMEVPLEEISPILREAVLKICPDPEKVRGLSLMIETLSVWQPLDKEKLPEAYRRCANKPESLVTTLQALPIENVRKNLLVKSVPLSCRDKSGVIQKDEQGRLTEYTNRRGNHFKVVYSDDTEAAYGDLEKMDFDKHRPRAFLPGVASIAKDSVEIYTGRVLGDGMLYCIFKGDYDAISFSLQDGDGKIGMLFVKKEGWHRVEYQSQHAPYPTPAYARLADDAALPESPEALRAWRTRFEAMRVGVEIGVEDGEPCVWLVLENTGDKPIELNDVIELDDNLLLSYERGGIGASCLRGMKISVPQTTLKDRLRIKIPEAPLAIKRGQAQSEKWHEESGTRAKEAAPNPPAGIDWIVTTIGLEKDAPCIRRTGERMRVEGEAFRAFYDSLPDVDSPAFKARQQAQADAIRASAGFEMEGGEPCFYIDLENTTGTPIELAKTAEFRGTMWIVREKSKTGTSHMRFGKQELPQGPLADKCRVKIANIPDAIKQCLPELYMHMRLAPILALEWSATAFGVERDLPVSYIPRPTQPARIEGEDLRQLLEYLEKQSKTPDGGGR